MTPLQILTSIFSTRSPELEASAPVDLRTIARWRWPQHLCCPLVLPEAVAGYLAGMDEPPTTLEKDELEEATMQYHGITAPYVAVLRSGVMRLMRE